MAGVDDDTRRFRRRLDDRPVRIWARRAFWFALGALAALAYVGAMRLLMGPL